MEIFIVSYVLLFIAFIILAFDCLNYKKKAEKLETDLELSKSELELHKEKYKHCDWLNDVLRTENEDLKCDLFSAKLDINDLKKKLKGKGKK